MVRVVLPHFTLSRRLIFPTIARRRMVKLVTSKIEIREATPLRLRGECQSQYCICALCKSIRHTLVHASSPVKLQLMMFKFTRSDRISPAKEPFQGRRNFTKCDDIHHQTSFAVRTEKIYRQRNNAKLRKSVSWKKGIRLRRSPQKETGM